MFPSHDRGSQYVLVDGIALVEQASTTTTTIAYEGGKVTTLTHAAVGTNDETMRNFVQDAIKEALQTAWNKPVYEVPTPSYAISGIAIA